ncbi:DUF3939 domain-containing protein [Paenibacillus rhizoplanae]
MPQIKQAVRQFEEDMPAPINRTALIQEDKSIDLIRLKRYLGGVPQQKFYMSSETFEIFLKNLTSWCRTISTWFNQR